MVEDTQKDKYSSCSLNRTCRYVLNFHVSQAFLFRQDAHFPNPNLPFFCLHGPALPSPPSGAHLMSLAQNKEYLLALEYIRRPGRALGLSIWPHQWSHV